MFYREKPNSITEANIYEKKLSLIITACLALTSSLDAFGQGYAVFASTKASGVYFGPNFYPNTNAFAVPANNTVTVGFMWANLGTPLVGTNGTPLNSTVLADWNKIMFDPLFHFAINATTGTLVSVPVNNSGLAQGGWSYNGSASFPLQGSSPGSTIKVFAVAWSSSYPTPQLAVSAGSNLGYSALFNYQTGLDSGSAAPTFDLSGMPPFQYWYTTSSPEPSSAALLTTGLVCWFLRKRHLTPQ